MTISVQPEPPPPTPPRGIASWIARGLLVILVLALGVGVFVGLVRTKPGPEKKDVDLRGALVEVREVTAASERVQVTAKGTVQPAREVVVMPEVSGRVVAQSDELLPGGRFEKGQTVLRIDPTDYALALKQQQASVERARLDLEVERSRVAIAKKEWEIIGEDAQATPEGRALALRQPQLKTAKTSLKSAKSARATAKVQLGRTTIRAPFNAMVITEAVDVGQLVTPATQLLRLVGTDRFWVQVSLPLEQLQSIEVPGANGFTEGAKARVWQEAGGIRTEREGRVVRLLGDLDPVGRMARVIVELEDPLGLGEQPQAQQDEETPHAAEVPLLIGSYVNVEIEGRKLVEVIEVPRAALREGNLVYVYDDGKLDIREVAVAWRRKGSVLVRSGLRSGEKIVVSRLPAAVQGMDLRLPQPDKKTAAKREK